MDIDDSPSWISLSHKICGSVGNDSYNSVILKNSYLDGSLIPPWDLVKVHSGDACDSLWEDPKGLLQLSARQKKKFGRWVRFTDNRAGAKFFNSTPSSDRIMQGFVGDCSFLSSLSSLSEYESQYKLPVLTDIIKYIDVHETVNNLKQHGFSDEMVKYLGGGSKIAIGCKIFFNGTARCILVDDWTPVREDGRLLCAHSKDDNELWVTLLEKAFVKLLGGTYSVQGTNPGVDIYHLSGWIPEIIQLPSNAKNKGKNTDVKRWNDVWDSLYAGFSTGSCVICLGTSNIWDAAPSGLGYTEGISLSSGMFPSLSCIIHLPGIVSCHAYSVLNVKEIMMPDSSIVHLLFLKNPWGKISWMKKFSPIDIETWTEDLRKALGYYPSTQDNGTFWIEWEEVLRWFSHLYLCWNPNIFQHQDKLQCIWDKSDNFLESVVPEDIYLSVFNPQLRLRVSFENKDAVTLWLMLVQHKLSLSDQLRYLAMHVFAQNTLVVCPTMPDVQGVYNNGECILLKLMIRKDPKAENATGNDILKGGGDNLITAVDKNIKDYDLIALLSYYMKKMESESYYTIQTFSTSKIYLQLLPPIIKDGWNRFICHGQWNEYNCGGNPNHVWQFFTNPHYRLEFKEDTYAIVLLESQENLSLNLRIFYGRIATVRALKTKHALTSQEYKIHCCNINSSFKAGVYTVIPSTFKGGDLGNFRIVIHSPKAVNIYPIPYPHAVLDLASGNFSNTVDSLQERDKGCSAHWGGKSIASAGLDGYYFFIQRINLTYNNEYSWIQDGCCFMTKSVTSPSIINFKVQRDTLMSIKIEAEDVVDNVVLFGSDMKLHKRFCGDNTVCDEINERYFCSNVSCSSCGGPCGQFFTIDKDMYPNEVSLGYEVMLFSDLHGGISKNGRVPSAAAQHLYQRQSLINFTLVSLKRTSLPYRLVLYVKNARIIFTSNDEINLL